MIDVDKAVRLNRTYSGKLGWDEHLEDIGRAMGFDSSTPGEEDLAGAVARWQESEGLGVDGIIGPNTWRALSAAIGVADSGGSGGGGGTGGSEGLITADRLGTWRSGEAAAFRRRVYERQLQANLDRNRQAFPGLPDDELEEVDGGQRLVAPAAAACRDLLDSARREAPEGVTVAVGSAYRDPERDFRAWQNTFETHYDRTEDERQGLDGGPHGEAALDQMVRRMRRYKAVPGFSNHTRGRAVDFVTTHDGTRLSARSAQRELWLDSWLHGWLVRRASEFSFTPYEPEPWHWEHTG